MVITYKYMKDMKSDIKRRGDIGFQTSVWVVDFESLACYNYGFESHQVPRILSCKETFQLANGTSVVLLRCPLVTEIMYGGEKSPYYILVSVRLKTENKQTDNRSIIIYDWALDT